MYSIITAWVFAFALATGLNQGLEIGSPWSLFIAGGMCGLGCMIGIIFHKIYH